MTPIVLMKPIVLFAAAAALAAPAVLAAQDARLQSRLDARTHAGVRPVLDSARTAGLPIEPLVQKALEGAAKRADGARIVAAVRGLAQRLAGARAGLGPSASEAELVSGAAALQAGAGRITLEDLRAARPRESVALPLVVLADLIARGVPADTAERTIVALARSGADDSAFTALRRDVERDITEGAPPASAVALRARGMLVSVPVRRPPAATTTRAGDENFIQGSSRPPKKP